MVQATQVQARRRTSGFMRLCDITGESRILRKHNAAGTRYECNINARNIGRLLWIFDGFESYSHRNAVQ